MKEIKWLAENIRDELDDAEKYAKKALKWRDASPELSQLAANLAHQELNHADMLHEQVVRLIKTQQQKGVDAPPAMLAVWDWEHERMVEAVSKIRALLSSLTR